MREDWLERVPVPALELPLELAADFLDETSDPVFPSVLGVPPECEERGVDSVLSEFSVLVPRYDGFIPWPSAKAFFATLLIESAKLGFLLFIWSNSVPRRAIVFLHQNYSHADVFLTVF